MRRILRHVFMLFAALSLLLCVAATVVWVASQRGPITLASWPELEDSEIPPRRHDVVYVSGGEVVWFSDRGVHPSGNAYPLRYRRFPIAPLVGATAFLALFAGASMLVGLMRPSRRHRRGQCVQCGYDLRAHGKGERCPECGTTA